MDPAIRKVASKLEACLTAVRSVALTDDLFRDLVYRADDAADPAWWCQPHRRTRRRASVSRHSGDSREL